MTYYVTQEFDWAKIMAQWYN